MSEAPPVRLKKYQQMEEEKEREEAKADHIEATAPPKKNRKFKCPMYKKVYITKNGQRNCELKHKGGHVYPTQIGLNTSVSCVEKGGFYH